MPVVGSSGGGEGMCEEDRGEHHLGESKEFRKGIFPREEKLVAV